MHSEPKKSYYATVYSDEDFTPSYSVSVIAPLIKEDGSVVSYKELYQLYQENKLQLKTQGMLDITRSSVLFGMTMPDVNELCSKEARVYLEENKEALMTSGKYIPADSEEGIDPDIRAMVILRAVAQRVNQKCKPVNPEREKRSLASYAYKTEALDYILGVEAGQTLQTQSTTDIGQISVQSYISGVKQDLISPTIFYNKKDSKGWRPTDDTGTMALYSKQVAGFAEEIPGHENTYSELNAYMNVVLTTETMTLADVLPDMAHGLSDEKVSMHRVLNTRARIDINEDELKDHDQFEYGLDAKIEYPIDENKKIKITEQLSSDETTLKKLQESLESEKSPVKISEIQLKIYEVKDRVAHAQMMLSSDEFKTGREKLADRQAKKTDLPPLAIVDYSPFTSNDKSRMHLQAVQDKLSKTMFSDKEKMDEYLKGVSPDGAKILKATSAWFSKYLNNEKLTEGLIDRKILFAHEESIDSAIKIIKKMQDEMPAEKRLSSYIEIDNLKSLKTALKEFRQHRILAIQEQLEQARNHKGANIIIDSATAHTYFTPEIMDAFNLFPTGDSSSIDLSLREAEKALMAMKNKSAAIDLSYLENPEKKLSASYTHKKESLNIAIKYMQSQVSIMFKFALSKLRKKVSPEEQEALFANERSFSLGRRGSASSHDSGMGDSIRTTSSSSSLSSLDEVKDQRLILLSSEQLDRIFEDSKIYIQDAHIEKLGIRQHIFGDKPGYEFIDKYAAIKNPDVFIYQNSSGTQMVGLRMCAIESLLADSTIKKKNMFGKVKETPTDATNLYASIKKQGEVMGGIFDRERMALTLAPDKKNDKPDLSMTHKG